MSRGSDAPPLCESAHIYLASRYGREAVALLTLARGEGDQPKGQHLRAVRPAGHATVCRNSILRVAFTRGEIQLSARGGDLTLDLTAKNFDIAGHPRREYACGGLTRDDAQPLIAAPEAFLAGITETPHTAHTLDPLAVHDDTTDKSTHDSEGGSTAPHHRSRHLVDSGPTPINPLADGRVVYWVGADMRAQTWVHGNSRDSAGASVLGRPQRRWRDPSPKMLLVWIPKVHEVIGARLYQP
jgi:hypothetical protein